MKKVVVFAGLILFFSTAFAQNQLLDKIKKEADKVIKANKSTPYTADEAAKGIKEALIQGATKGSDIVSKVDGFYKNPEIKIPFPSQAQKVESALRQVGFNKQVDDAVLSLNRAAEDASKKAKDIFVPAIKQMTINDAIGIVKGDSVAGTRYLKSKTTNNLMKAFAPIIKSSLDKVNATKYWADVMNQYNKIPFVEKVNPDLTQYVTQKAIEGLFLMISKEESLIRRDPVARTTELLKKIFGK